MSLLERTFRNFLLSNTSSLPLQYRNIGCASCLETGVVLLHSLSTGTLYLMGLSAYQTFAHLIPFLSTQYGVTLEQYQRELSLPTESGTVLLPGWLIQDFAGPQVA